MKYSVLGRVTLSIVRICHFPYPGTWLQQINTFISILGGASFLSLFFESSRHGCCTQGKPLQIWLISLFVRLVRKIYYGKISQHLSEMIVEIWKQYSGLLPDWYCNTTSTSGGTGSGKTSMELSPRSDLWCKRSRLLLVLTWKIMFPM